MLKGMENPEMDYGYMPRLSTVPPEVLGNITRFLSPTSLNRLSMVSRGFREMVPDIQRELVLNPGTFVSYLDLERYPNVQRVRGSVFLPISSRILEHLSRRLRGSVNFVAGTGEEGYPKHDPQEALDFLAVRGLLYPTHEVSLVIRGHEMERERRYSYIYRPEASFLSISIPQFPGNLNFKLLKSLPFHVLGLDTYLGIGAYLELDTFPRLLHEAGRVITELVTYGTLTDRLNPSVLPHVHTLRFDIHPNFFGILGSYAFEPIPFNAPVPSVTRLLGAYSLYYTYHDMGTLPSRITNYETAYPNLQGGDITFAQRVHEDETNHYTEIFQTFRTHLTAFKTRHPRLTVILEFWESPTDILRATICGCSGVGCPVCPQVETMEREVTIRQRRSEI